MLVGAALCGCAQFGVLPERDPRRSHAPQIEMNAGTIPAAILRDAARRGAVDAAQVRVIAAEAVTWRDGSLGCPEPDRLYTQALVPGWRYTVQAGAAVLEYHADRRGRWVWCPPQRAQDPLPGAPI